MTNVVYRYLGYGTTNSAGTAKLEYDADGEPLTHSYTGVGAGEVDVVASLDNEIGESSIVSGTLPVLDATFYDEAVTGHKNSNWTVDRVTVSETDNIGTLLVSENGNGHYWANATSSSITGSFACEFDLISYSDTRSVAFRIKSNDNNNHYLLFKDQNVPANAHIKITYDGSVFKYQINDSTPVTWVTASYTSVELALRLSSANDSMKYANFVIYPI